MTKTKGKDGKSDHGGGALARSPDHLLHRVLQLALDIYAEESGAGGVTQRQYAVLAAVAENEGVTQTGLVRATGIDRSTLADMVARMITKGHLERHRSDQDARANTVSLTPAGAACWRRAAPRWPWPTPASWLCSSPASARASWSCWPTWPSPTSTPSPKPRPRRPRLPRSRRPRTARRTRSPKEKAAKKAA